MRCHERRAHRRTERVTIQRIKSDAEETAHGEVDRSDNDNWEDVATRWARVSPKLTNALSERNVGEQQIATTTVEFEFGHDSVTAAILPVNRFKHRNQIYEIDAVRNLEMRNQVILVTGTLIQ